MFEIYRDGVAFFGATPLEHFARTHGATARRLTDATNALFLESLGAVREASPHTEQLQLAQIGGGLLTRLPDEAEATDVAFRHDGHIVKLIGDEVMFVTVARDNAEAIARELVEWVAAHDVLTGAQAGVAEGGGAGAGR